MNKNEKLAKKLLSVLKVISVSFMIPVLFVLLALASLPAGNLLSSFHSPTSLENASRLVTIVIVVLPLILPFLFSRFLFKKGKFTGSVWISFAGILIEIMLAVYFLSPLLG